MSKNNFGSDEIKDLVLDFSKKHPGWTAIGAGIAYGIAVALPKLGPTIETCWKYSVDKFFDRLPKLEAQQALAENAIVDTCSTAQTDESSTE